MWQWIDSPSFWTFNGQKLLSQGRYLFVYINNQSTNTKLFICILSLYKVSILMYVVSSTKLLIYGDIIVAKEEHFPLKIGTLTWIIEAADCSQEIS